MDHLYLSKFIVACDGRDFVLGKCEDGHALDNAVHWCDCGLGKMMMYELYCVGHLGRSGGFCCNFEAFVVLKRYTDIPAGCTAEVPRVSCPGLLCAIMSQPRGLIGVAP